MGNLLRRKIEPKQSQRTWSKSIGTTPLNTLCLWCPSKIARPIQCRTVHAARLEFDQALKTTKNNKQAGPDGIAMELFTWMDADNRNFFLNIINHWWRHKQAPESIFRARVVSIFKKGNTDLPENYCPISLLTTIYKMYIYDHDQETFASRTWRPFVRNTIWIQTFTKYIARYIFDA